LNEFLGKEWVLDEPVKYFGPPTELQSHHDDWYKSYDESPKTRTTKNVLPFNAAENPVSNKYFKVTRFPRSTLADVGNTSKHPVINDDNDVKDSPKSELERIVRGRTLTQNPEP